MKNISKIIVYTLCLQLTVGSYPVINKAAYAQEDNSPSANEASNRSPASDNLNMDPNEVADNSKNYIEQFEQQCVSPKGEIQGNVAFVHDKEIGGEEPRMYNCAAAAEVIQKILVPGMNDVEQEFLNAQQDPNCPNCGTGMQSVTSYETGTPQDGGETPACSLADQKKFASQDCNFWCGVASATTLGLGTQSGCDASYKSAAVGGKCLLEIAKGVAQGIWDVLTFIPKLLWSGVKWVFGIGESKTSEKAHALSHLSNDEIKKGKENPEALKQTFLQKAGNFFKEFGQAVIGYPEYAEKAKCATCGEKAAYACGIIGNTGGFLLTLFGNGLIFGATKGLGTKIASKVVKFSKGTSVFAKTTSKTLKVLNKTGKYVSKPFIAFGNVIVKGASKISKTAVKWWQKFKGTKTFASIQKFKNTGVFKKVFAAESIPGKITLKIARGVKTGFHKMGAFEDRMFMKGVSLTNKELHATMLRAQNINKLRALNLEKQAKGGETTSAATNEALKGVDELKVVKDSSDGRSLEDWNKLKKTTSNELGVKQKYLDDIENSVPAEFTKVTAKDGTIENKILVDTSKGSKEVKLANPTEVQSVHTYQDGKYAIVKNKDGSYILHDMDDGVHLVKNGKNGVVPENKSEYIDALLGKKTKNFDDLESMSYDQVKTNLKINGTKYTEEVDAAGNKVLKIETPTGCTPKTLTFGVDKAI